MSPLKSLFDHEVEMYIQYGHFRGSFISTPDLYKIDNSISWYGSGSLHTNRMDIRRALAKKYYYDLFKLFIQNAWKLRYTNSEMTTYAPAIKTSVRAYNSIEDIVYARCYVIRKILCQRSLNTRCFVDLPESSLRVVIRKSIKNLYPQMSLKDILLKVILQGMNFSTRIKVEDLPLPSPSIF